jgi:hypothetical protein
MMNERRLWGSDREQNQFKLVGHDDQGHACDAAWNILDPLQGPLTVNARGAQECRYWSRGSRILQVHAKGPR